MNSSRAKLAQGFALHKQGNLAEAVTAYRQVLASEPRNGDALHLMGIAIAGMGRPLDAVGFIAAAVQVLPSNPAVQANLGNVLNDLGRHAEAVPCFDGALALQPDLAAAYLGRGNALLHLNQLDAALTSLGQAVRLAPNEAKAHSDLGVVLEMVGRDHEALQRFQRAITLNPRHAEAHHNLGLVQTKLGRYTEALASLERAVALQPRHPAAHVNLGNALCALGRPIEALASFDRALKLEPASAAALLGRGIACVQAGQPVDAIENLDRALALAPDQFSIHLNRGIALDLLERYEDSLASLDRAVSLDADSSVALNNRGVALSRLSRWEEALESHAKALAIAPDYAEAYGNAGDAQRSLKLYQEAGKSFDRAISLDSQNPRFKWGKALVKLALGEFREGWPLYESRLELDHMRAQQRRYDCPRWTGEEDVGGKTVFVHAEQGLGDTLQFARYIPLLEARGANVILEVQPALKKLLGSLEFHGTLIGKGEPLPPFDLFVPLLSLPLAFRTALDTIPDGVPYLQADPEVVRSWRERLGPLPGLKIGLNWQGEFGTEKQSSVRGRSFPLAAAAALARLPGTTWVSLQKGPGAAQRTQVDFAAALAQLTDPTETGPDEMVSTAALLMSLDLVVTSDTAVAHLAGALGVPVWVVLHSAPDWRWFLGRDDSPWYSTMRLFRQHKPGDWLEVFTRVTAALERRATPPG